MKLKAVEEHLQEKRRHAPFRELQELDEEKLKVAKARRLGVTQQQVSKLENGERGV